MGLFQPYILRIIEGDLFIAIILFQVTDFGSVVGEVRRILRPGGYFYFAEWMRNVFMADGSLVEQHAPQAALFFSIINTIMQSRLVPLNPDAGLAAILYQSQHFEVVQTRRYSIVLGNAGAAGLHFRDAFKEYADALKYLLMDSGYTEGNAEQFITGFKHDIDFVPGLTVVYCTILARKLS